MNKEKSNKTFWNRFAFIYDFSRRKDAHAYNLIFERIQNTLNQNMNVLELATGTGVIAVQAAPYCKNIVATDFSEEMINIAKQKEKPANLIFEIADATDLKYKDCEFDAVIISNALHIMPNPQKAIDNIRRVLKDDGILIAPTYMRSSRLKEKLTAFFMGILGFKTFTKWTLEEYLLFLKENGWLILKSEMFSATFPLAFVTVEKKL
ncbi:SAM-dependent methyltransferase [Clostridia bacterium]|nr:SAM-dependent methyltransferase [Clostridia bacterium]